MKTAALAVLLLASLGAGYLATRHAFRPPQTVTAEDKLAWLSREFSLAPDEAAEIRRVQEAYAPICAKHCADIAASEHALDIAVSHADRLVAQAELERLRTVCAEATRGHLRAVAALMPDKQGERFLRMMEPRVTHGTGRTGAPDLSPAAER